MKLPAIKKLVETCSIEMLQASEEALLEDMPTPIEVDGSDEGEKLTHVMAAIFIKTEMAEKGLDYPSALRAYTARVRTSIS